MDSNESKTSTVPAVLGQKDVPGMLLQVEEQIRLLKKGMPAQAHTTSELPGFGKINDIKTVDALLKAASSVQGKYDGYMEAGKKLMPDGMKIPTFKLGKSTYNQWMEDIKGAIIVVANKTQLDKLNLVKATLKENLSAEAKLAAGLASIGVILTEGLITDDEGGE